MKTFLFCRQITISCRDKILFIYLLFLNLLAKTKKEKKKRMTEKFLNSLGSISVTCVSHVVLVCVVSCVVLLLTLRIAITKPKADIDFSKRSTGNIKRWFTGKQGNIIYEDITRLIRKENIRNHSRHYSLYPHHPGSKRNEQLARQMANIWKQFGLDKTEIFKYKLLLSFPEKPAEIHLLKDSKLVNKLTVVNEPGFAPTHLSV